MAELTTEQVLAKMSLRALKNNNLAINLMYKDLQSEFKPMDKHGGIVNVKKPPRFQSYQGVRAQLQTAKEETIPVKVDKVRGVAWSTNMIEASLTRSEEATYKTYIEPAMIEISSQLDLELFGMTKKVHNALGTPGTTPSTYALFANASARMTNIAVPDDSKRKLVMNPDCQASMADTLRQVYSEKKVDKALEKMSIGNLARFDMYTSASIPRLTVGTPGGTPKVDGAGQTGTSIVVDGFAATGTLKEGEIITFSGVYDVHPVTRQQHNYLKQFVLNSDFTAVAGAGTLDIRPGIITTGAYQNCSGSPANNADIVQVTNLDHVNNIAFYEDAFCVQFVPIRLPKEMEVGHTETRDGISVTVSKGWDVMELNLIYRVDVLYGYRELYADQAVRIFG